MNYDRISPVCFLRYTGWLTDTVCMNIINGNDGVNSSHSAPNHTVACMLVEYCRTRGYSVLAPVDDGSGYRARFQLDAAGNAMAVLALEDLERRGVVNNAMVTVTGTPAYFYSTSGVYTQLYFFPLFFFLPGMGLISISHVRVGHALPVCLVQYSAILIPARLSAFYQRWCHGYSVFASVGRGSKAFATTMAVSPPTQLRIPFNRRTGVLN